MNYLLKEMESGIQGLPSVNKDDAAPKIKSPEQQQQEFKLIKSLKTDKKTFDEIDDKKAQDLITQAHERAEEIETVAFGMELDDGEIVKIYVNAEQSEAFEKALGDMLGAEDDVEVAIEKLADEYDIVSVEWPEERGEGYQGTEDGITSPDDAEENSDDVEDDKEFALDFDLSNKKKEEDDSDNKDEDDSSSSEEDKEESDKDEDKEDDDSSSEDKDKEEGDDLDLDLDNLEDEDEAQSDEDEEEEEDDTDEKDKGKKKKKKKNQTEKDNTNKEIEVKESFLFADFLNRPILTEAKKEKPEVFSKDELKIEDIFNTAFQQKIAKLLFLLDFPVDRILLKKSLFRKGIRNAALELNSNSRAKLLIGRLIKDLSVLMSKDEMYAKQRKVVSNFTAEDLHESPDIDEKLTNELQKLIIKLYKALGVPDVLLNTKTVQLKQDIRKTARALASHTGIKSTLKKLAKALDIDTPIDVLEEGLLSEDLSNFSSDDFVNLVVIVAEKLGIPEANLNYKKSMVVQQIMNKKQDLIPVKNRLVSLAKVLSNIELSDTQMTTEEVNSAYMHRAADLGNWSIATKGENKLTLSIEDVIITLEGKDLDLFKSSIDNGLSTIVKDGNEEWQFKSIDHGKKYIAINENSDKYLNGILLHEKDVNAILNIIDED